MVTLIAVKQEFGIPAMDPLLTSPFTKGEGHIVLESCHVLELDSHYLIVQRRDRVAATARFLPLGQGGRLGGGPSLVRALYRLTTIRLVATPNSLLNR